MMVMRAHRWIERIELPPALLRFWICIVAMTGVSFLYTMAMTYVFRKDYPYGPPQFFADDRWFDFTIYHDRFQHFRTASFWDAYDYPFTYPAPLAVVYGLLYKVPHVLRIYLPMYGLVALAAGWLLVRALRARGIPQGVAVAFTATALAFNYPLRTLYESANTEGLVAILAGLGVFCILRERCWLGASLIAVAGTMKIFPLVLLALLLSKRRYREFAWGAIVAAGVTLASLAVVGPTIGEAQRHIDEGIRYVKYWFVFSVNPAAVTFNHSLFTLVKFSVVLIGRHLHPMTSFTPVDFIVRAIRERALLETTFNLYVVAAALFGIIAYFGWIRRLPLLNQVLALSVCALVLPPLSADYTLLHLLFPFALLCVYAADMWRRGEPAPGLIACFVCFAFIFSFETYLTLRYRFSCEMRTLAMIALFLMVMRHPFRWDAIDRPRAGKPVLL